jgi:hypothetical protein
MEVWPPSTPTFNCNQLQPTAEHKTQLDITAEHAWCGFKSRSRH